MTARMANPSLVVAGTLQPLLAMTEVIGGVGVPQTTLDLVRMLVSQLNGREHLPPADTSTADERLSLVRNWREEPRFSDAERAALALAEDVTILVEAPDSVWHDATLHYSEREVSALVMHIGLVNLWNRVNVATRQDPAPWR